MRNVLIGGIILMALISVNACTKCYTCHNYCKVCREQHYDTTLTIIVQSDVLGQDYFNEYIDSLTSPSLGWTCGDTTSTQQLDFCGSQSQNNTNLLNKRLQGYICAPKN